VSSKSLDSIHCCAARDQARSDGFHWRFEEACVSESHALVRRFFEKYTIPEGSVVLSDRGTLYFPKGEDVLLSLG
jgi:hypothetical protein